MKWKSLVSTQNLKLAWRRINTARNLQYKRFFREAYLVYESDSDEHIKELHKALAAKAWQPSHATRLFLPKPSGLQRPLSLLDIEDQIVFQAIANQFAAKLYKKRQRVELESVFSNNLASPRGSIFFMERWQTTYSAFQDKCTDAFNNGLRWSAHFDLSAYYDTISHDLLLSIVSPNGDEFETINTIKDWLRVWSADNISTMTGHGIPQGPIASDFLAEAFFLPIDLQLQKATFQYIRYVDDIRLFGRTDNEVREAAIRLEQECRHRGLIPQSAKFDIRKLNSADEAMGSLPSISPTDGKGSSEKSMSATQARRILASAIGGRPKRIKDKARFRYIMYRAPEDTKILTDVLRLLPRHPEHIDAFVAYFTNYRKKNPNCQGGIGLSGDWCSIFLCSRRTLASGRAIGWH
jgi:retron-type reverse transcriptase